ncbi:MAG: hypothetical protein ACLU6O_13305, partial [Bilophila wadsworthia]
LAQRQQVILFHTLLKDQPSWREVLISAHKERTRGRQRLTLSEHFAFLRVSSLSISERFAVIKTPCLVPTVRLIKCQFKEKILNKILYKLKYLIL